MLEELSLLSNRGSRLFKMRQRRSEKYTFESIQNEANTQLSNDVLNENTVTVEIKVDPPADDPPANTNSAAASGAQPLPSRSNLDASSVPRSYHSPWEQEILSDPSLAETIKLRMPGPDPRPNLPEYKSFNRVATPFGGFKAITSQASRRLGPGTNPSPSFPELQAPGMKRPSFNRTAQGWITEGTHMIVPTITLESVQVPESDDL
uniref:Myozenin 2b n=1 Tax=Tetraodon nigroviridis TaxID=99883 RepID=H3BXH7_TETNG